MSAAEIITEIDSLPETEREKVLGFAACRAKEQLTAEELGELTKRMIETNDPAEEAALRAELVRGFYGNVPHA